MGRSVGVGGCPRWICLSFALFATPETGLPVRPGTPAEDCTSIKIFRYGTRIIASQDAALVASQVAAKGPQEEPETEAPPAGLAEADQAVGATKPKL
eukprot:5766898-Alexandrium_andersonii.AAC.1